MVRSYLPALVFVGLGLTLGVMFTFVNAWLGARQPRRDVAPYGLPPEVRENFRFGIGFYLIGILFIIFDLEVILLVLVVLQVGAPWSAGRAQARSGGKARPKGRT